LATDALYRATLSITEADLPYMVLEKGDLPSEFSAYEAVRESVLDNETMAKFGFPGSTTERFRQAGRITGYVREFGASATGAADDGADFMAATVAHLFDSPDAVSDWMHDIFLRDFEDNVGREVGQGQVLLAAEYLEPQGFFDEAVALRALHNDAGREVTVTIVDFRVGRILGVAFVGVLGDHARLDLATTLGLALEKRIVGVALE
jgi:hypothetical protein